MTDKDFINWIRTIVWEQVESKMEFKFNEFTSMHILGQGFKEGAD